MEDWESDKYLTDTFNIYKKIGSIQYKLTITIYYDTKVIKYWVSMSSGRKRKQLEVYEDKSEKSNGSISILLWAKKSIDKFPEYYRNCKSEKFFEKYKKEYICINWSDSRRRDIYSRLKKYGYYFMKVDNEKILIKEIKWKKETKLDI